ncbi:MAG: hypothetical protein MRERC_1c009 [Mycoplasmataceae bacterium RC_NB112A]|nr:MAG: hypothetical protein MRERC_9c069 [Mycoplasmataceae bacterium RC_NB112A]KLL02434.1 MAG: hypothetical protein MRERC_1c009 [Mycoplasmataceae bacterium RC_NB112A]
MSNIASKEYIKNLIVRSIKGEKISQEENAALEKEIFNFTATDWRNFKIVGKEVIKEGIDKYIDKSQDILTIWKSEWKNLAHAVVNFSSALLSEEFIVEAIRLEKEEVDWKQRGKTLAPLLIANLEKMTARKPVYQAKNLRKAEKSFVERYKNIKSLISMAQLAKVSNKKPSESKIRNFVAKFFQNCKNISADEIKVFKKKVWEWAEANLAKSKIASNPEIQPLIKAVVNFLDVVCDEEIVSEFSNIVVDMADLLTRNINFEEIKKINVKNFSENFLYGTKLLKRIEPQLKNSNFEEQGRSLTVKLTNHFNLLAGDEVNSQPLSLSEEQVINQRIEAARELSDKTNNPSNNIGSGLGSLNPLNLVEGEDWSDLDLNLENLDKKMSKVETSPKWYQNPWIMVPSLVGAAVVGGFIVWLLMRKKDPKRESRNYY